jgi:hypothetical protein
MRKVVKSEVITAAKKKEAFDEGSGNRVSRSYYRGEEDGSQSSSRSYVSDKEDKGRKKAR